METLLSFSEETGRDAVTKLVRMRRQYKLRNIRLLNNNTHLEILDCPIT